MKKESKNENQSNFDPFRGYWNLWPEPVVKFFFTQAEAKLKQLIEAGRRITDRAASLLTWISIPFFALATYLFRESQNFKSTDYLPNNNLVQLIWDKYFFTILALVEFVILFITCLRLVYLLFPREVMPLGKSPSELILPEYLIGEEFGENTALSNESSDDKNSLGQEKTFSDEDRNLVVIKTFLIECKSYEESINFNEKDNNRRNKILKRVLRTIIWSTLIIILLAVLNTVFRW
ncbi:MAG: hypothetical protein J0L99_04950 [Chitinophagales bacterium]|nr:hypothetical protein [Chitinophagales bacterium]